MINFSEIILKNASPLSWDLKTHLLVLTADKNANHLQTLITCSTSIAGKHEISNKPYYSEKNCSASKSRCWQIKISISCIYILLVYNSKSIPLQCSRYKHLSLTFLVRGDLKRNGTSLTHKSCFPGMGFPCYKEYFCS